MNSTTFKPNVFVVQNGKLIPKETQQEEKKNYRYVPYDPANNPQPEDYFRETISRLQKENHTLRVELDQKLGEFSTKYVNQTESPVSRQVQKYQEEISVLRAHLAIKTQELEDKNKKIKSQDKQILEMNQENQRLHTRINNVMKELENLNNIIQKKDEEIIDKKFQIDEYCRSLERLTMKENEEQRTMYSSSCQMTPRAEEREEESNSENNSYEGEKRYMTPEIYVKMDENSHLYRSQKHQDGRTFGDNNSNWGTASYAAKQYKRI